MVIQARLPTDPQFWKDCPLEKGCIIEFPLEKPDEEEAVQSEVSMLVEEVEEDGSGLWLKVRHLGSAALWAREMAIRLFSRERRQIHVCREGCAVCSMADDPRSFHLDELAIFPVGMEPPDYVERGKRKEWKKRYEEIVKEAAEVGGRGVAMASTPAFPPAAPDRISALRSRLQARTRSGAGAVHGRGIVPPAPPLALADAARGARAVKTEPVGGSQLRLRTAAEVTLDAARAGKSRDADGPGGTRGGAASDGGRGGPRAARGDIGPAVPWTSTGQSEPKRLAGLNKRIIIRQSGAAPAKEGSEGTRFRAKNATLTNVRGSSSRSRRARRPPIESELAGGNKLSSYFQIAAKPQIPGKVRDTRELETLARCVDLLKAGRLPELGDALAGRFLAVESAALTNNWHDAQHLEVVPSRHNGLAGPAVLLQAQRHARQVEKAAGRGGWRRMNTGGGDTQPSGPARADEKGGGGAGQGKGRGKGKERAGRALGEHRIRKAQGTMPARRRRPQERSESRGQCPARRCRWGR